MLLFTLLFSTLSFADSCDKVIDYRQFYNCSLEKHPDHQISKLKLEEAKGAEARGAQWENPEVELKSTAGDNFGEKVGSDELSISIPVSQLWKNGVKRDIGKAEKNLAEIESQEISVSARKKLILSLYRLRQLDEGLAFVTEALDAFGKIQSQFKQRLARGPEQEITLNLVELATGDYELKRNHYMVEKAEIVSNLKAIWGPNFTPSKELLPPLKEAWPKVAAADASNVRSFETRRLLAQADKLRAESSLAVRESWPDVKAGPTIEKTREGLTEFYSYGVNISVTLPIFSLNSGGRRLAAAQAQQAEVLATFADKKANLENEILIQKYQSAVDSLKRSTDREELKKKHQKIDSLFKQGLASGGIVIEAHRQIIEFTESQHEHENTAIESFIDLKSMRGENVEEILQ